MSIESKRTRFVVSLQVYSPSSDNWKNHNRSILRFPSASDGFDIDELIGACTDKDKIRLGLYLVEQLQKMVDCYIEIQSRNTKEIDDSEGRLLAENVWPDGAKSLLDLLGPINGDES